MDRVLINANWAANFSDAICINELALGSDHAPMVLLSQGEPIRDKNKLIVRENVD